ncbi:MAG: hypothetical protein HZB26_26110 [Candidatus Hydrogenedentes bacterium]|nr:hypothetical protein [Candidatus Hydrogenedentota bacterium]
MIQRIRDACHTCEDQQEQGLFAWHGFEINTPPTWELGSYHGGYSSGDATLDDGVSPRLHLTWRTASRRRSPIERMLAKIKKAHRKRWGRNASFEVISAVPTCPEGQSQRYVRSSTPEASGLAWWCRACGRSGVVEEYHSRDNPSSSASPILDSFRDHRDDGTRLWSAYGLSFELPTTYLECRPSLSAGRLRFQLLASARNWCVVERWAMASVHLRRLPLNKWPAELAARVSPKLGPLTLDERATVLQYPAIHFKTSRARVGAAIPWLHTPTEGLLWQRPESDKLLAVITHGPACDLLHSIAAGVRTI